MDSISIIGARTWPLVGRVEELDLLLDGFDRADRHGVVLAGPPGVGKSRLAQEAVQAAVQAGWSAEHVMATEGLDGIPFGAVSHLLPQSPDPDRDPLVLFMGVAEELQRRAPDGRLALMVDDAHLLDEPSAVLLHQLARTGRAHLVATVRTDAPAPAAITALWKDGHAIRIDLPELSPVDTVDLLRAVLGGPIEGATRRRFWSITHGNALFLRESVLSALSEGSLEERDDLWRLRPGATLGPRLAELVDARLRTLTSEERAVLEVLAVAEPIGLRTLIGVVGDPALITKVERDGYIVVSTERRRRLVRTGHPMHREIVRQSMPQTRLLELQRRLSEVVTGFGARRRDDVLRVAHWRLDAEGTADPELLVDAATRALGRFDDVLALRLSRAALDAGGGLEAALRCGEALRNLHAGEEAIDILSAHADAARTAGESLRRRYLDVRVQTLLGTGDANAALAVIDDFAHASPIEQWRAWIEVLRFSVRLVADRSTDGLELIDAIARDASVGPEVRLAALESAAEGHWYRGNSATALEFFDQAIELIGDDTGRRFRLEYQRLGPYHHTGPHAMEDRAEWFYERAVEAGWHYGAALWAQAIAVGHLLAGRADRGCGWLRQAVAAFERSDPSGFLALSVAQLATGEAMRGRVEEVLALRARADQLASGDLYATRYAMELVDIHLALAERRLTDAVGLAMQRAERLRGSVFNEASALHTALRVGAPAGPVSARLGELAPDVESDLVKAWARQAHAVQDGDGTALEELCDLYERIENPLWAAEAAAQAARAYAKAGKQDSARRAAAQSRRLREGVEDVWTPALELDEGPAPLRPREREVAEMAGAGMSNAQIAEVLGISARTVETHLQRAYVKLGVNRREDLRSVLPPR